MSPTGCGRGNRSKNDAIIFHDEAAEIFGATAQLSAEQPGTEHIDVQGPTRTHLEECFPSADGEIDLTTFHWRWFALLENYHQRGFTRSEDKLIAMSGIADRVKIETGSDYIAGLWRET